MSRPDRTPLPTVFSAHWGVLSQCSSRHAAGHFGSDSSGPVEEEALVRHPQRDLPVDEELDLDGSLAGDHGHLVEGHLGVGTHPHRPGFAHHPRREMGVDVGVGPHVGGQGAPLLPQHPQDAQAVHLEGVRPGRGGGVDEPPHVGKVRLAGGGRRGHVGLPSRRVQAGHDAVQRLERLREVPLDPAAVRAAQADGVVGGEVGPLEFPRGGQADDEFEFPHGRGRWGRTGNRATGRSSSGRSG